jgi:hypothetical protein
MRPLRLHLVQRTVLLAVIALLSTALTGCQIVAGSMQYTQVRYIDASPDAPNLDIYQNAVVTLYDIGFGTASSYIAIAPGSWNFSVDVTTGRQQLANVIGTLALGAQYTVLIGNIAANLQMTLLKDQSTPAPSGQVAFRFLDQSTRNAAVDIYLLPAGGSLATLSPIATHVAFGNTASYINVPIGTYSVVILPTGAIPTAATVPLYSGTRTEYLSGAARTIVLIDQQSATTPGFQVISADDYDSPAAIT